MLVIIALSVFSTIVLYVFDISIYLFDTSFSNYGWPRPTANMNGGAAAIIALLVFLCSHNLLTHLHHSCICICIYSLLIEYYSVSEWNFINKLHDLNLRWRWLWSCQIAKVYWDVTDSSDAPKDHIPKSLQICDWLSWYRWLLAKQELSTSSCFSKFFSSFSPLTQCHNSHSSWVR